MLFMELMRESAGEDRMPYAMIAVMAPLSILFDIVLLPFYVLGWLFVRLAKALEARR